VIKAAALQRVMNFASSIRSQKDIGPMLRRDRADFGDGNLKVRKHFQQERLEFHVRAIDFVYQQYRGACTVGLDRFQQRPLD
jgi:hypothetical protein